MVDNWSCSTMLLLLVTLSLPGYTTAAVEEPMFYDMGEDDYKITDDLAQKWGQCPIPAICLTGSIGCGTDDGSGHIIVSCTHRAAGPYMPDFTDYVISRRTWTFNFSNNGFVSLDSFSFVTTNLVPVNLTSLDLSHNDISEIKAGTFSGAVSKDLVRLILSYNRLTTLETGIFDDLPAIQTLDLSYNSLLSIDSLCGASFPMLTDLNVKHNSVSNVALGCLSGAVKSVSLILDDNYIGSVNDCSYSSRVTNSLQNNPILCGCSEMHKGEQCLQIDSESNTTSTSYQPTCDQSGFSAACLNVTFDLSYESISTHTNKKYDIQVKFANDEQHKVELLEYIGLRSDSVSAKLLQSDSAAVGQFSNESPLATSSNYTVCVSLLSDSASKQRRCQFLSPPYFYPSNTAGSLYLGTAALWMFCSHVLLLSVQFN